MAWRVDRQTGDIVINGFEKGIAPSPHLGIGNLQAVNLVTEPDEVMCSYARTQQSMTYTNAATGTLSFLDSTHVDLSISGTNQLFKGMWITVSNSTHTSELNNGNYYVTPSFGNGFQLTSTFGGSVITGYTSGLSADIILLRDIGKPIASTSEIYTISNVSYYRYYILDNQGLVWVYDTHNETVYSSTDNVAWFLPDYNELSNATGITILNGWILVFYGNTIAGKLSNNMSSSPGWVSLAAGSMTSSAQHTAFVGHQSTCYYTDGNLVGSIFPTTSYAAGVPNVFSYAAYTASSTTGTIASATFQEGGLPSNGIDTTRIPAVFFTAPGGTLPSAITAGTVYYIQYSLGGGTFEVYSGSSGGAAIDISTGAVGTQYFNTFCPTSSSGKSTYIFSPTALTLPFYETALSIAEVQSKVVIGCTSNTIYQWDQASAQPSDFIPLPENNVVKMITVNNMAYALAGSKGNIYITNGSTASLALTVPDYTTGLIEPYFVWGDIMYLRGRVYFSIQDQISGHTGQCGGVWSFVPTQNFFIGQDTGLALRMENQNSYGTYNGLATVLIPAYTQTARGPQYWSGWTSNAVSSPTYGIDFSSSTPSTTAVIETDLIPTGTFLQKETFFQVEYKLAAPLVSGESVSIKYRTNLTDSFTSFTDALVTESSTGLSGYYPVSFEKTQWLQLQVTLTPISSSSSSFCRLMELRIR